jgi:phosphatidylglycerol:prolipoprotein diacylglycerol transferase
MHATLAAILHRLDPYAIGPFGGFGIRWYGLAYAAGFLAGFLLVRSLARRGRTLLEPARVGDLIGAAIVGTIAGGRLGYCIFYSPELLTEFSGSFPFWGALAIHKGGMASHGGLIGMVLACVWCSRKLGVPAPHLFDLIALAAPIGIFFGRLANFVNGELLGRPASAALPWAVKFPQEIASWADPAHPRHELLSGPELHEAAALAASGSQLPVPHAPLQPDDLQRIIAAVPANDEVARTIEPLLTPRHPSQLYEALLEGAVLFLALAWIWRKPQKPGVVAGWCLVIYAAVRIIGEQFRMPDEHIGFQWLGLTRGQWLSLGTLGLGLLLLAWSMRAKAAAVGGWLRPGKP